jgi:hypothetical protein
MKKKVFALVLLAAATFSCSSDDNGGGSGSVSESKLMKRWYNESYKVFGQTIPYDDHEECGKDYIEFMDGGMARYVDVWMCNGNSPEIFSETFGWSLSGKTLTIIYDEDDVEKIKIKTLTDTKLEIEVSYDFDDDGVDDKIVEVYTSTP